MSAPLLQIEGLVKHYPLARSSWLAPRASRRALDGVDFAVRGGRSFGIVGESGSGKSTLARLALALERPSAGAVRFLGRDLNAMSRRELRAARADFQMIFQDPYGSLDPRHTIGRIVAEPLLRLASLTRAEREARAIEELEAVGLDAAAAAKYPHEFSGGQRQRIAIARALATRPKLVVADEPVSALDVSIQAQTLNLMTQLQREAGVTFLLISHDLAVVGHLCDDLAVMFQGRFVETGACAEVLRAPAHPYTRELVAAAPVLMPAAPRAAPPPPRPEATGGCAYAARCARAQDLCLQVAPPLRALGEGRAAACHFPGA